MSTKEFILPIKGYSAGLAVHQQPSATSGYMNNVRPRDVLEMKLRIGQRPGLKKEYAQQVGGAYPIVWLGEIITVD